MSSHLKVGVVITGFEKVSLAARCPQTVEGQGLEAGRHTGSLLESQVSSHRNMIRVAVCSLQADTHRGPKTRHEFQGEVLNFGYHLGLEVLNSEVRLYLGLNDHGVSIIAMSRKVRCS